MDGETTTHISILPWPSGAPTSDPARVVFDRKELALLLSVYGRKVAAGEWRDYAIDFLKDRAVFSVFRRSTEYPLYRIEKNSETCAATRSLCGYCLSRSGVEARSRA